MTIRLTDHGEDRTVTLEQLRDMLGARTAARTTIRVAYRTDTVSPVVYFTALASNGVTVLVSRRTSGVTVVGPFYTYLVPVTGVTDFIAVWDEGDVTAYEAEWVVVDT